jgi:hypothetical protein
MSDLNAYLGEFDSRAYIFSDNKPITSKKKSSGQKQFTSSSKVRDNTQLEWTTEQI